MKCIVKLSNFIIFTVFVIGVIAITPVSMAQDVDEDENTFDKAELFIELNDTAGDLGLQAFIDGGPYNRFSIKDPRDRTLLLLFNVGRLAKQGLTELFFESAEPPFDQVSPDIFFRRFPEGIYEFEGRTLDGEKLENDVEFTHVLPAAPENINITGIPAAEDCDALVLPEINAAINPVIIDWDAVTESHPEIGVSDSGIEITGYKVFVLREEPELLEFSIDLPPTITEVEIPAGFIALGDEFKFEIQTFESSGNITAIETCFKVIN
ncbi:MAG: hypothetical protein ACRENO_00360 [Thermodesulfobacteriota bacterium]